MKWLVWGFVVVLIVAWYIDRENAAQQQTVQMQQPITNEVELIKLSAKASIGASKADFIEEYGPINENGIPSFQNDSIHVIFGFRDLAERIILIFENTEKPRRTQEEVLSLTKDLIPIDADFVKKYQVFEEKTVYVYKSGQLKVFNDQVNLADDKGEGICSIVMEHDEGKPDSVYSVHVAIGDNP